MAREPIQLSVELVQKLICVPSKSGKVCSFQQAVKFIMLCKARGLNPYEGDAYLIGYDGKAGTTFSLITAHQAFLKRAEVHPEFDGMDSGVIVKEASGERVDREGDFLEEGDILLGGWATVYFKNRSHPMKRRLNLEKFKKPFGRWLEDAAGMIVKVAEGDALRSAFPTSLGGMYLERGLDEGEAPNQPAPLPIGRVALGQQVATPPVPPAEEQSQECPEPTPEEEERDASREDRVAELSEEIGQAQTPAALRAIGQAIESQREWLGPAAAAALLGQLAAQEKQLAEVKGGK